MAPTNCTRYWYFGGCKTNEAIHEYNSVKMCKLKKNNYSDRCLIFCPLLYFINLLVSAKILNTKMILGDRHGEIYSDGNIKRANNCKMLLRQMWLEL